MRSGTELSQFLRPILPTLGYVSYWTILKFDIWNGDEK